MQFYCRLQRLVRLCLINQWVSPERIFNIRSGFTDDNKVSCPACCVEGWRVYRAYRRDCNQWSWYQFFIFQIIRSMCCNLASASMFPDCFRWVQWHRQEWKCSGFPLQVVSWIDNSKRSAKFQRREWLIWPGDRWAIRCAKYEILVWRKT